MTSLDLLQTFKHDGLAGKADTTVKTYIHALQQFAEFLAAREADLTDFTRLDVQEYINYLAAHKKSPATMNKVFQAIATFSRFTERPHTVDKVRVIKPASPLQSAPESIEKNELLKLIRKFEKEGNARNMAILMVLASTGIRVSELVGLDISDVEMSERKGLLRIRSGKGNKARNIPLNSEARHALGHYMDTRNDSNPALFLSNRQVRISARMVQTMFEAHGIHVHQFRHTFITRLMRDNTDIATIQAMTGHASADMLLRYSRPSMDDCAAAVEKLFS